MFPKIPNGFERCSSQDAEKLLLPSGVLCDFDQKGLYVNIHYKNSYGSDSIITIARNDLIVPFGILPVRLMTPEVAK